METFQSHDCARLLFRLHLPACRLSRAEGASRWRPGLHMGDESALHAADGRVSGAQRRIVAGTDVQAIYLRGLFDVVRKYMA